MGSKNKPWWLKPVRVIQFNIEDRYGTFVSKISGKDLVKFAHELGANVLVIFARDPWGRVYYRGGKVGPTHPKMKGDIVREAIEEGRRLGVKVVVMIGHTANKYVYETHTDWAQVNVRGEPILLEHAPYNVEGYEVEWPQICINSPYIALIKEEIKEVIDLGVDGVFLDSFRYQPDIERACYCRWCSERFRGKYGYDMPKEPNWRDSRWRTLWRWRYEVVVERLKELYEHTKELTKGKEVLFMYNSHPGGWSGRTNRIVDLGRGYYDAVFAECSEADHQPPGFITEMVKLTKAMNGGKPVMPSRNYFHMYRTAASTTPIAVKQGLREAIIAGGSPWLLIFSSTYFQSPKVLKHVKEAFKEHEVLEEYLDGAEPLRYAGVVVSNLTRDFYGGEKPDDYVDETRGFYYALTHYHIPVEYISESDLTRPEVLKKYRVLVLANTVCMSDSSVGSLRTYVKGGGKVLATYLTSLYDDEGVSRNDLALSDVFGAEIVGVFKSPWSYIVITKREHPLFEGIEESLILWGDMSYDFRVERVARSLGWHVITRLLGSEVVAKVGTAVYEWGFEYTLGRSPPPFAVTMNMPAIILNTYGEGTSIYFTGQLGRHYWRIGLPEYGLLIKNSITYLGGELPVKVDAPETLATEFFRQNERLIIHLLNHTYNQRILAIGTGKVKQPLPPYSSTEATHPPRTVIPVSNVIIRVSLKELGSFTELKIFSPLSGKVFSYEVRGDWLVINVPSVNEYEVVVVEPKG